MIGAGVASVLAFLGRVPWQVWAGIALILAVSLSYCHGKGVGEREERAEWIAKLEKAEADAEAKAKEAAQSADEQQQQRADEFEAEQESLREIIDDAESIGANPLDALIGGLW